MNEQPLVCKHVYVINTIVYISNYFKRPSNVRIMKVIKGQILGIIYWTAIESNRNY